MTGITQTLSLYINLQQIFLLFTVMALMVALMVAVVVALMVAVMVAVMAAIKCISITKIS